MAFDFPNSPALNATWPNPPVVGQPVYTWDGEKWLIVNAPSAGAVPATALPLADGVATVGVSVKYAREDHVHPIAEAHGQCKLVFVSATQIKLTPVNGNNLKINGAVYPIPAAGITLSNASMVAATQYYIYAWMNAGVMTLEFSSTTHASSATAGNVGVEIKFGDDTRSLVGMIYANGSAQFGDNLAYRGVRTWFNDSGVTLQGGSGSNIGFTNTGPLEIDGGARTWVLRWANENFMANAVAQGFCNTTAAVFYIWVWMDATPIGINGSGQCAVASQQLPMTGIAAANWVVDGWSYFSVAGATSAGTTNYANKGVNVLTAGRP